MFSFSYHSVNYAKDLVQSLTEMFYRLCLGCCRTHLPTRLRQWACNTKCSGVIFHEFQSVFFSNVLISSTIYSVHRRSHIRSLGLWQRYINITITILDTIHHPVLFQNWQFWDLTCLHVCMEPTQKGITDRASLSQDTSNNTSKIYTSLYCWFVLCCLYKPY
jgi:hypothetical protein